MQREQAKAVRRTEKAAKATSPPDNSLLKRKRSDVDESDPKLKEFLEAMQPKSKSETWNTEDTQAQDVEEPPRKVQAMELPEAESDSEYEIVPKKSIQKQSTPVPTAAAVAVVPIAEAEPLETEEAETRHKPTQADGGLDATDDDWLRSRTSRLLDLVDPMDAVAQKAPNNPSQSSPQLEEPVAPEDVDIPADQRIIAEEAIDEEVPLGSSDPTVEVIQTSGRLFVRNLPYSVTEDDLRKLFESYGTLEEVITFH